MNAIKLLDKLRKCPVFGAEEVAKILNCNKKYANLVLTRLYNKKAVKRIESGKYTLCNLAQTVATYLVSPSYITGWYALRFYNLTEQLPQQIDVLTTKKKNKKILIFNKEKIKYLTVNKKYIFEFFNEVSEQYTMSIASIEKTIVDCLYFNLAPLSAVIQAIKTGNHKIPDNKGNFGAPKTKSFRGEKISLERIKKICLKLKNKQFLKKIGIVFDSLNYDFYNSFKKYLDYNPLFFDKNLCGLLDKTKLKKWRVKCQ